MVKLKNIRLVNFGGYEDTFFDFSSPAGALFGNPIKSLALFYGPNGFGKSTVLEAVKIICNPLVLQDRPTSTAVLLRSKIRDDDYNPTCDAVSNKEKRSMRVEATFLTEDGDKSVILTENGFLVNELPLVHNGHVFYVDADHPINWSKFQLISDHADKFIELAETIYGFDCDLDGEVWDTIVENDGSVSKHLYYQDFIITKGNTKVHFSSMSAGEKKIATMIRQLCNPDNLLNKDIILVDNICLHIYFKRHAKMLDKLLEFMAGRQLIATTHSSAMIAHVPQSCRYDMETYRPEYSLSGDFEMSEEQDTLFANSVYGRNGYERVVLSDGTIVYAPSEVAEKVQGLYNMSVRTDIVSKEQYQEDVTNGITYEVRNTDIVPSSETTHDSASLSDFYETSENPTLDSQISMKRVAVPNNASSQVTKKPTVWSRLRSFFAW